MKNALPLPGVGGITEINSIDLVLFGMQNRALGPPLTAINRILISVMNSFHHCN
jgi:hypothetical protein